MDEYKKYLAEQILTEDKPVTYRSLSRALKVHVNTAKQMLYDFHASENEKRQGSVYATYLVYGTKKAAETNGHVQPDGDVEMTSSMPEVESLVEEVPVFTLSIVAEDKLNDVLSQYEQVTAIHVYSVGPQPVKDWQLLSDVNRPTADVTDPEDSEAYRKICAAVINPYVRRRERKGAIPNAKPATKQESQSVSGKFSAASKIKEEPKVKEEVKPTPSLPAKGSAGASASASAAKKPAPSLKRGGSGGIMQSFARAAAMPKKAKAPQPATPSGAEDSGSALALSDDGEDDATAMPEPKEESAGARKSRKQREAELRRMMEEDDEEPEEEPASPKEEPEEPVEEPAAEPEPEKEPEPAEVVSSAGNGRRRGKRRVMRKKQILDEQGYLVTVQEPGWESFSEDEAPPPPKKKQETSAAASQPAKAKKAGAKSGQGSIMSFFSKK